MTTHLTITSHRGEVLFDGLARDVEICGRRVRYSVDLTNDAGEVWSCDTHTVVLEGEGSVAVNWETGS